MGERMSYAPGTPSWVDLGSPNPSESVAFYGSLLGWVAEMDPRPEAGGYGMFSLGGKLVAGLGPQMNTEMPPYWSVYVSVADAAATLAKAADAGGTVVMDAMQVFDAGRMGIFQDPGGSFLSVWEPLEHIGAQLVNDPGSFGWNELASTDIAKSKAFYTAVFGWGLDPNISTDMSAAFTVDSKMVCGAHTAGEGEFPAWSAWFTVEDCDKSAATVTELGGQILAPPMDMDFGRGAVVADPHGAVFGLAAINEPAD